jgi:hypothetical protein
LQAAMPWCAMDCFLLGAPMCLSAASQCVRPTFVVAACLPTCLYSFLTRLPLLPSWRLPPAAWLLSASSHSVRPGTRWVICHSVTAVVARGVYPCTL